MGTDGNTYCDHFIMYKNNHFCTPEMNIILHINYNSIKKLIKNKVGDST